MAQKSTFGDAPVPPSSFGDAPVGPSLTEQDYNRAHPDQGWFGDAIDFAGNIGKGAVNAVKGMFTPNTQIDPEIAATPRALATPALWQGMGNPNADPDVMRPVHQFQDNDMAGLGQSVGSMVPTAVMLGASRAAGVPAEEAPPAPGSPSTPGSSSTYLKAGAKAVANKAANLIPGYRAAKTIYKVGKTAYDFHKAGSAAQAAENAARPGPGMAPPPVEQAASSPAPASPLPEPGAGFGDAQPASAAPAAGMQPPPSSPGSGSRMTWEHDSIDKHTQDAINKATNIHDFLVSKGITAEQFGAYNPAQLKKIADDAWEYGKSKGVPVPNNGYKSLNAGTSTHGKILDKLSGNPFPWETEAQQSQAQPPTPSQPVAPTPVVQQRPAQMPRMGQAGVPVSHPTTPVTVNGVDPTLLEGIAQGFGKSYARMSPQERLTVQHLASKMQAQQAQQAQQSRQAQGMTPPPTVQ